MLAADPRFAWTAYENTSLNLLHSRNSILLLLASRHTTSPSRQTGQKQLVAQWERSWFVGSANTLASGTAITAIPATLHTGAVRIPYPGYNRQCGEDGSNGSATRGRRR
jgi:hypothetical protein